MTWFSGTAVDLKDMHRLVRNKVCGYKEHDPITFSGVGDGQLTYFGAKPGSANETWTITCTTGGLNGVAIFSVVGSTTGALADATAGTYYDTPQICFMIVANSNDFVATTDVFQIVVTGDGQATIDGNAWVLDQEEITSAIAGSKIQMHGIGLSLDKHVGIISELNHTTTPERASISFLGCAGYNDLLPISDQPASDTDGKNILLWDSDMDYYIVSNNQRFVVLSEVSGTGHGAYCGFFFPYGPPSTYGFPMYVGTDCDSDVAYAFGDSSYYLGSMVDPGVGGGRVALPGGSYENIQHYSNGSDRDVGSNCVWPTGADYSYRAYRQLQETEDGTYSLYPCVLMQQSPGESLGELDGVCAIPGSTLARKDVITDKDGVDWVVWNDTTRTGYSAFYAVRLV